MEDGDELLLALSFDDDGDGDDVGSSAAAPQETARETRIRRALEEARREYKAQVDHEGWFLGGELSRLLSDPAAHDKALENAVRDALRAHKRTAPHLEWAQAYLYTLDDFDGAFRLCKACLDVEESSPVPNDDALLSGSLFDVARATIEDTRNNKQVKGDLLATPPTRQSLDAGLRSLARLLHDQADSIARRQYGRWLIAAAIREAWPPVVDYDQARCEKLVSSLGWRDGSSGIHWTAHAGLMLSAAELAAVLQAHADAVEAYSHVLAARGLSDRTCLALLASLGRLAEERSPALIQLMKAVSTAALLHTPTPSRRLAAVEQIEAELGSDLAAPDRWTPKDSSDPCASLIQDCHETTPLSLPALVTLIHGAIGRRSSVAAYADRFAEVLAQAKAGAADEEDSKGADSIKIFTSVKKL